MSDLTDACTENCWHPVTCRVCGKRKAPRGRSVALEAGSGLCGYDCLGYWSDPSPGRLWPEEGVYSTREDGP
jgi:hypothetical protein